MPGYLGNDPSGSATKIARQTYTTSGAATTDFTFTSGYDVGYLDVYVNGERQTKGKNFTASDGSTFRVLNGGVGTGSTVEAIAYKTFNLATVDFDDLGNTGDLTLSGDISAVDATFSGDVSIGGTLTYEDVTNIDSVGVITARAGVDIITGGIDIVGNTTGLNVTGVGTFVDVNVSGAATVAGDLVIADKIVHSGDTNTAIRFPAADTFTVETGGGEALRVDSSQRLLIGATGDSNLIRHGQAFAVATTDEFGGGSFSGFNGTTANEGPIIDLQRSRATSKSPGTVVVDNDRLGSLVFRGDDGTDFADAAYMLGEVDGTPSGGFVPGRLTFYTGTTSSTPVERLRISNDGEVGIGTDDPSRRLQVQANGSTPSALFGNSEHNNSIEVTRTGSTGSYFQVQTYTNISNIVGGPTLTLRTSDPVGSASTERVRIDSSGNLGIGSASPARKLDVDGVARVIETVEAYDTSGGDQDWFVSSASFGFHNGTGVAFNAAGGLFRLGINGTERVRVDVGGNVNITGITTANQLFEGTSRVATAGKAVAMALVFG